MCWKFLMHLIQLKCDKYSLRLASVQYNLFSDSVLLCWVVTQVSGCWVAVSAECCLIKVIKRSSGAKSVIPRSQHVASVGVQCLPWAVYRVYRDKSGDQCSVQHLNWTTTETGRNREKCKYWQFNTGGGYHCAMEVLLWTMEDRWWNLTDREVNTNINGKCNYWQHYYSVFLWFLSMP